MSLYSDDYLKGVKNSKMVRNNKKMPLWKSALAAGAVALFGCETPQDINTTKTLENSVSIVSESFSPEPPLSPLPEIEEEPEIFYEELPLEPLPEIPEVAPVVQDVLVLRF